MAPPENKQQELQILGLFFYFIQYWLQQFNFSYQSKRKRFYSLDLASAPEKNAFQIDYSYKNIKIEMTMKKKNEQIDFIFKNDTLKINEGTSFKINNYTEKINEGYAFKNENIFKEQLQMVIEEINKLVTVQSPLNYLQTLQTPPPSCNTTQHNLLHLPPLSCNTNQHNLLYLSPSSSNTIKQDVQNLTPPNYLKMQNMDQPFAPVSNNTVQQHVQNLIPPNYLKMQNMDQSFAPVSNNDQHVDLFDNIDMDTPLSSESLNDPRFISILEDIKKDPTQNKLNDK